MPIIGEDIDNKTNLDEGYLRMFYNKTYLKKDKSLNLKSTLTFKRTIPKYIRDIGDSLHLNTKYTIKDLLNEFEYMVKNKHIDDEELINTKIENITDLFKIAVEIEYYWGLSYPNSYLKRTKK